MKANLQTKLIKVYPFLAWGFGGFFSVLLLFPIFMALRSRQYDAAIFFLLFTVLPIYIFMSGSILCINDHIIVVMTLLTRHQIGWDEVESIEVSQNWAIRLQGSSSTGTPKKLMIVGPTFWFGNKKQIRRIFARQVKMRQIQVKEMAVETLANGSSKTTRVSVNSDDPETYIAASSKFNTAHIEPTASNIADQVNSETLNPLGYRSAREIALESKMRKPEISVNLLLGAVGGFIAAVVGALIWAAIAAVTHYEFSLVSIGVGLLVGFVTKTLAGKGGILTGLISAGLSVMGCMLGSTLGLIMIMSKGDISIAAYIFFTFLTHPASLIGAYALAFGPMDIFFYVVAIINSFRMTSK